MTNLADRIADNVYHLTEADELTTAYHRWDNGQKVVGIHRVKLISLLDQLAEAMIPTGGGGQDGGSAHQKPKSRPPVDLNAVHAHQDIMSLTSDILLRYPAITPRSYGLCSALRAICSYSMVGTDTELRHISQSLQVMVAKARQAVGATTTMRPFDECPECKAKPSPGKGPVVASDARRGACLSCGATWTRAQLQGLMRGEVDA